MAAAYLAASLTTVTLASLFYTQQVLAKQAAFGAVYTREQQIRTYIENLFGLAPSYGVILAIALLVGFLIAAALKRVLTALAPVAYPIAGAAAVLVAIWLIENVVAGGGVGALGGARDAMGLALQGLAGFVGGAVFAVLRGR